MRKGRVRVRVWVMDAFDCLHGMVSIAYGKKFCDHEVKVKAKGQIQSDVRVASYLVSFLIRHTWGL